MIGVCVSIILLLFCDGQTRRSAHTDIFVCAWISFYSDVTRHCSIVLLFCAKNNVANWNLVSIKKKKIMIIYNDTLLIGWEGALNVSSTPINCIIRIILASVRTHPTPSPRSLYFSHIWTRVNSSQLPLKFTHQSTMWIVRKEPDPVPITPL